MRSHGDPQPRARRRVESVAVSSQNATLAGEFRCRTTWALQAAPMTGRQPGACLPQATRTAWATLEP